MAVIYRKCGRRNGFYLATDIAMATFSLSFFDFLGFRFLLNTIFGLILTASIVTVFLIYYPISKWTRKGLIRFVKWRYPQFTIVDEISVRSLLDQGRNQGIYTLLLQGKTITDGVRNHLLQLTATRSYLRSALTTVCGFYAWKDVDEFSVDSHLITAWCSFKGRPIIESNLQDFVSDVTSKFLPPNQSPWQVFIINCFLNGEETKVCVIRAHHLLLRQEHLKLPDFLPLKYFSENWAYQENDSPLTNLYSEPSAIPRLRQMLTESFSNYWNEFLCNNDPTESPEILKKRIGLCQYFKIAIIVCVSVAKEMARRNEKSQGYMVSDWLRVYRREASRRNFNSTDIFWAFIRAINPIDGFYSCMHWLWYISITMMLKVPFLILAELNALRSSQKQYHPETLTSMVAAYLPLIFKAIMEVISIAGIVITAPNLILKETFFKSVQTNHLQTLSLCGRKIVAWSDDVDVETIRNISLVTGATETEIILTATAAAFMEYFKQSGMRIPPEILATAKFVSQRSLFIPNREVRGVLCLALPTKTPLFDDDLIETLQIMKENVQEARYKQRATYAITAAESSDGLVSSFVPSLVLKLALLYLTRRYSLSMTYVDGDFMVEGIDSVMYWRPPQGYCSMSLTLHSYGRKIRLGIIGDAMIRSQHIVITKAFSRSVQELAVTFGVPRTPTRSRSPGSTSPASAPDC